MKKLILIILVLPFILFSCSGDPEEIIPVEPVGSSTTVITGAVSTTLDYEAEFLHSIGTIGAGLSSLTLNLGNIGQTESVVVIKLIELGNKQGFSAGSYNFDVDPNAPLILICTYIDDLNSYSINLTSSLTNQLTLSNVGDTKITGEFEFSLESPDGAKINLVGSFEAVGETFKL